MCQKQKRVKVIVKCGEWILACKIFSMVIIFISIHQIITLFNIDLFNKEGRYIWFEVLSRWNNDGHYVPRASTVSRSTWIKSLEWREPWWIAVDSGELISESSPTTSLNPAGCMATQLNLVNSTLSTQLSTQLSQISQNLT